MSLSHGSSGVTSGLVNNNSSLEALLPNFTFFSPSNNNSNNINNANNNKQTSTE